MPRPLSEYRTGSKESFYKFRKSFPEIKVDLKQFNDVLKSHGRHFTEHILQTGDRLKFSFGLGYLTICGYKKMKEITKNGKTINNLAVDWSQTLKLWSECEECKERKQLIRHLNHHTQGYNYYWRWTGVSMIKLYFIWTFKLNREHSRKLNIYLKSTESQYKENYKSYT